MYTSPHLILTQFLCTVLQALQAGAAETVTASSLRTPKTSGYHCMQLFVTSFGPIEAHPSCGNFATTQFASSLRARSLSTLHSPVSPFPQTTSLETIHFRDPRTGNKGRCPHHITFSERGSGHSLTPPVQERIHRGRRIIGLPYFIRQSHGTCRRFVLIKRCPLYYFPYCSAKNS